MLSFWGADVPPPIPCLHMFDVRLRRCKILNNFRDNQVEIYPNKNTIIKRIGLQQRKACRKMRLNSAQKPSVGLGALPTKQLGCVPQATEWGTPGMLHAGVVRL